MRSGPCQEKYKFLVIHSVNKQPVGLDVTFPEADKVTGKGIGHGSF